MGWAVCVCVRGTGSPNALPGDLGRCYAGPTPRVSDRAVRQANPARVRRAQWGWRATGKG
jgi:hypothetical protein